LQLIPTFCATAEAVANLERALSAKPTLVWKKPAKARCQFSPEELKAGFQGLKSAEASGDWGSALKVAHQLLEGGVTWDPTLKGHLALAMVAAGAKFTECGPIFETARDSMEEYPLDYAPYLTIAILKFKIGLFGPALEMLRLASLCPGAPLQVIQKVENRMKFFAKKDNPFSNVAQTVVSQKLLIMQTIREMDLGIDWAAFDATINDLGHDRLRFRNELETNTDLQKAVVAALYVADGHGYLNFVSDLQDESPFTNVTVDDFEAITKFLDIDSICNLRTTCRFIHALSKDACSFQYAVATKYGLSHELIPPQRQGLIPSIINFVGDVASEYLRASKQSTVLDEEFWLEKTDRLWSIDPAPYPILSEPNTWIMFSILLRTSYLLGIDAVSGTTTMLDQLESRFSILEFIEVAWREFPSFTEPYIILSCLISIKGPRGHQYTLHAMEKGYFGASARDLTNSSANSFHALMASRGDWYDSPNTVVPFWEIETDSEQEEMESRKDKIVAHLTGLWHFSMPCMDPFKSAVTDCGVFTLSVVEDGEESEEQDSPKKTLKKVAKIEEKVKEADNMEEEVGEEEEEEEEEDEDDEDDQLEIILQGEGVSSLSPNAKVKVSAYFVQTTDASQTSMRLVMFSEDGTRIDIECTLAAHGRIAGATRVTREAKEEPLLERPENMGNLFTEEDGPTTTFAAWKDSRVKDFSPLNTEAAVQVTEIMKAAKEAEISKAVALHQAVEAEIMERYPDEQERSEAVEMAAGASDMLRMTLDGMHSLLSWSPSTATDVEHWISELSEMCGSPEQLAEAAQLAVTHAPLRGPGETEAAYNLRVDALQRFLYTLHVIRRGLTKQVLLRSDAHGSILLLEHVAGDPDEHVSNTIDASRVLDEHETRALYMRWSQILMLSHDSLPNNNSVVFEILDSLHNSIQSLHESIPQFEDDEDVPEEEEGTAPRGYTRILHQSPELRSSPKASKRSRRGGSGPSPATVRTLAIVGVAVAAISAGAYFLGRWFTNKKQTQ
jgi:hypothetical protein